MDFGRFQSQIKQGGTPSSGYVVVVDDYTGTIYKILSISRSENPAFAMKEGLEGTSGETGGSGTILIHITTEFEQV